MKYYVYNKLKNDANDGVSILKEFDVILFKKNGKWHNNKGPAYIKYKRQRPYFLYYYNGYYIPKFNNNLKQTKINFIKHCKLLVFV